MWFIWPWRAGQHGVVVGNHHAAGGIRAEFFRVHGGDAGDQAVGRGVADEVVDRAAAALGGDGERAVFDERTFIDELGDVLARCALVGLAAALDRGRAVFIQRDGVALDQFGQIGTDVIEIDVFFLGHVMGVDLGRLQIEDRLVLHQRHAGFRRDLRHPAAMRRGHQMLHLHGFQHGDLLAGADEVPLPDVDSHDRALQRRGNGLRACRPRPANRGFRAGRTVIGCDAGFDQRGLGGRFGFADEISDMGLDEAGADAVLDKIRMRQNRRQERDVGGDAADPELAQRPRRLVHDVGPVTTRRMHDDLGEQRVKGGAGAVSRIAKRIDANARAGRQVEQRQRPAGRPCPAGLVHHLHVDAELHRKAARFWDIGLRQTQRTQRGAGRDRKLRLHEIEAEYFLGDGMLDLEPRIGLDEGERLVTPFGVVIDEEFEGAEVVIMRGGGKLLGGVDDAPAQGIVQRRARRDLDELLVATLDGAFALPEMADRAMVVADDLHLDVAGIADQALDIDAVAAEGRHRLGLAARIGLFQLFGVVDDAHAAAAAAGDRLDHDGATGP